MIYEPDIDSHIDFVRKHFFRQDLQDKSLKSLRFDPVKWQAFNHFWLKFEKTNYDVRMVRKM